MDLNELSKEIHKNAIHMGFWKDALSDEHCLALVITEVSEAIEADRKNKRANVDQFMVDKFFEPESLIEESPFKIAFEHHIKDTVEDEFADIVIRLLDIAGSKGWDVFGHIQCITSKSITENAFKLIQFICKDSNLEFRINLAVSYMVRWSKEMDIDLEFHIKQKMRYNSLRKLMHDKKY